jgi:hypothetical protein
MNCIKILHVRTSEWSAAFFLVLNSITQITTFLVFLYRYDRYEKILKNDQTHAKIAKAFKQKSTTSGQSS